MQHTKKLFFSVLLLTASTSAQASLIDLINNTTAADGNYGNVTVTFGGIFPEYDSSVLDINESMMRTSHLLQGVSQNDLRNTSINGIGSTGPTDFTGLYVETFDTRTTLGQDLADSGFNGSPFTGNNTQGPNSGCAVNGVSSGVVVTGDYGVTSGNIGGTAVIDRGVNDNNQSIATTCFAYTPTSRAQLPSAVELDFGGILDSAALKTGTPMYVDYIGFFWGTIDRYNSFSFFQNDIMIAEIDGSDLFDDFENLNLGRNGEYVNFIFDENAGFDKLVVTSTGIATEFDNIVNRISPARVPEPTSVLMMAIALLAMVRSKK